MSNGSDLGYPKVIDQDHSNVGNPDDPTSADSLGIQGGEVETAVFGETEMAIRLVLYRGTHILGTLALRRGAMETLAMQILAASTQQGKVN